MKARYDVTREQRRDIARKMKEIERLVDRRGGSPLDPADVSRKLQMILEPAFAAAPTGSTTPRQAAAIMGRAMYGAEAQARHFGVELDRRDAATVSVVPFSQPMLEACRDTHLLILGARVSILRMLRSAPDAFYVKGLWYAREEFARNVIKTSWYLIRRDAVPGSTGKYWNEQQGSTSETEVTPAACQVVLAIILHYLETGERLMPSLYVRTADVDSGGARVMVGRFTDQGLRIESKGDLRDDHIGAAGARRSSWHRQMRSDGVARRAGEALRAMGRSRSAPPAAGRGGVGSRSAAGPRGVREGSEAESVTAATIVKLRDVDRLAWSTIAARVGKQPRAVKRLYESASREQVGTPRSRRT